MKGRWRFLLAALGGLTLLGFARPLRAQNTVTRLWEDTRTHQVFTEPGRHRVPFNFTGGVDTNAIEQRVEEKVHDQVRAAAAENATQERYDNSQVTKQITDMQPAWKSFSGNFLNKFKIGTLVYLDYAMYTHPGFGPQFSENYNPPGPGNENFNAFDVSRVYLNLYFTPTDDLLFRFTPELYRANGNNGSPATNNTKIGRITGVGSNLDGDMNVRMKYAYIQYHGLVDSIARLKGGNVTFGAQGNPFIPWEEDLYQYRFVNLVPWNYVGLSSSQIGLQFDGPIKSESGETTLAEYGFGAYDNGSFRTPEQTNTKQVMARGTIYPFGAHWRYDGLGMTGFFNYGWGNTAPDSINLPTPLKASNAHFERIAALLHYSAETWNLAGEFDYGQNAFNLGNLFSGSGPLDAFGTPTGKAFTSGTHFGNSCGKGGPTATAPCYNTVGTFGPQTAIWQAILQNGRERNIGWDVFGHFLIPDTKLTAFGMFQWFRPNDNVANDPLDFMRFVAGLSYQYNEYLRIALDSQNLLFYHKNSGMTTTKAARFNYPSAGTLNGQKLPTVASGTFISNLVPRDTHAVFLNLEFAY
jgi:hypothetical protein